MQQESEGILQHTVPGSVALTLDGKRAYVSSYPNLFPHGYELTSFLIQVSQMHVVLFRLVPRKKTKTVKILVSGSKLAPRVVGSNGRAKVLPRLVVVWSPIRKTRQQAGRISLPGNDLEPLRSDLPLRSPCPS